MATRLALIPMNPTVGDLDANVDRALACIDRAHAACVDGAPIDAAVLPEMAICGYPPRDLVLIDRFPERCAEAADTLAARVAETRPDLTLIVGAVLRGPGGHGLTNSLLVSRGGVRTARYDKRLLPTYDVFDEDRYFEPGDRPAVVEIGGRRVGLAVCEDLWRGDDAGFSSRYRGAPDPVAETAALGALDALVVPSASPFVLGKHERHRAILDRAAGVAAAPVLSINQLGGNDDLIFDGRAGAVMPGGAGEGLHNAPFSGEALVVDLDDAGVRAVAGHTGAGAGGAGDELDDVALAVDALTLGVRDYLGKCGFKSACLGLSGGIDSALTAAIAVRALGADAVLGAAMPGPFSSEGSVTDAVVLAENLRMPFVKMPIAAPFDGHRVVLDEAFASLDERALGASLPDLTQENLQSRARGALMMGISNRTGALLLTTGNKSELAVGYCTLYGDMNGGLAVLSDVPKTLVFEISRALNDRHAEFGFATPPIPEATLTKPPSAELAPDQLDSDSLPDYSVLDEIVERHVEGREGADAIIEATGFDDAVVRRVCRMIDLNEYKRRQLAVGLKITATAFGPGRRMPIAQRFVR